MRCSALNHSTTRCMVKICQTCKLTDTAETKIVLPEMLYVLSAEQLIFLVVSKCLRQDYSHFLPGCGFTLHHQNLL